MKDWVKINECRAGYIAKHNRNNELITTLTEEQHEVIQHICAVRHEIHCSIDEMFNTSSSEYSLWQHLDNCNEHSLNGKLQKVGMPTIEYGVDTDDVPSDMDYFEFMSEDEKEEWENKAQQCNNNSNSSFKHTGFSLWREKSEEYEEFTEIMEKINNQIEKYLAKIDEEHGTNYCPSGCQRLY